MDYNSPMDFQVFQHESFKTWLANLKDRQAAIRILSRVRCISIGNFGDHKFVRDGIHEMRVDYGPGYRIYYVRRGDAVVVLLAGGDKRTQTADIELAIELAKTWQTEPKE
jgi:putative addiction module killer protein